MITVYKIMEIGGFTALRLHLKYLDLSTDIIWSTVKMRIVQKTLIMFHVDTVIQDDWKKAVNDVRKAAD
jgi:hypothetical protein